MWQCPHAEKRTGNETSPSDLDFHALIDALPHFIWVKKLDGTAEFWSRSWFDYTGLIPEHTHNGRWTRSIHPDDRQRCLTLLEEMARTGESQTFEYRVRGADDTYRWFLGQAFPHRDDQGDVLYYYGTATAIEEQKQAEEVLIQANGDQRQFISMVSHEFRTALTTIEGFSNVLQEGEFSTEEVKDFARTISTDALRLHRMSNDLLDLEKMHSGKMVLQCEMSDFNALVKEVIERMSSVSRSHTVSREHLCELPLLWLDPDKITQVMMNLLLNAIKYSPGGGEVSLHSAIEGNVLHLWMEDQGIGIAPEHLEQIFTPYNRIHAKKTQFIQGTGLGLPIVRRILELHGGSVWAESTLGQGSIFHVTLPFP